MSEDNTAEKMVGPSECEPIDKDAEATPALNREQRRAQARGKSGATSAGAGPRAGQANPGAARSGGHAGQVRFPRTGHK